MENDQKLNLDTNIVCDLIIPLTLRFCYLYKFKVTGREMVHPREIIEYFLSGGVNCELPHSTSVVSFIFAKLGLLMHRSC